MSDYTPDRIRIGDREREATSERLSKHAVAGRLTYEELEERLERAQAAVFARDLAALEADLPARRSRPRPRLPYPAFVALVAAILVSILVGHPIPPLFILAVFLWVRARRYGSFPRPRFSAS
jgi:uncharacterized protein DUF1707